MNAQGVKFEDLNGHWAEEEVQEWIDNGMIAGYPDHTFRPDKEITRGEFVALVNTAFGYSEQQPVQYKDVKQSDWVYPDVQKAKAQGYMNGYPDLTFRPNQTITRQEVASVLSNILKLIPEDNSMATTLHTSDDIPQWSKAAIYNVVTHHIMVLFEDGTFQVERRMTRAEVVVALTSALRERTIVYDKPGDYGDVELQEVYGDVIIQSPDVTLKNMRISGNLLFSKEIGDGDVSIDQVEVIGTTRIEGGGIHSIHLKDSQIGYLYVNRVSGAVRVIAEGSTNVQNVQLRSNTHIVEKDLTDKGFINLEIPPELNTLDKITIDGDLDKITLARNVEEFRVDSGSISSFIIQENLVIPIIHISKGVVIHVLHLKSEVTVTGEGIIKDVIKTEDSINSKLPSSGIIAFPIGGDFGGVPPSGGGPIGGGDTSGGEVIITNPNGVVKGALLYLRYDNPNLLAINDVYIRLEGRNGTTGSYNTTTDTLGKYTFSNIPPGTYLVTAHIGYLIYYDEEFEVTAGQTRTLPNLIIEELAPEIHVDTVLLDYGNLNGFVNNWDGPYTITVELADGTVLNTPPIEFSSFVINLNEYNPGIVLKHNDKLYITLTVDGVRGRWESERIEVNVVERPKTAAPTVTSTVYEGTMVISGTVEDWSNQITVYKSDGTLIAKFHQNLGNTFGVYLGDHAPFVVGEQLMVYAIADNKTISDPTYVTVVAATMATETPMITINVYEDTAYISGMTMEDAFVEIKRSDGTIIGAGQSTGIFHIYFSSPLIAGETLYITAKGYENLISSPASVIVLPR